MTENLVPEVREFLEGLDYNVQTFEVTPDARISWRTNRGHAEYDDSYAESLEKALIYGLEHFLKVELGKHWMIVWHETEAEYKLEPTVSGNVASAIDYLFKLREVEGKSE